MQLASPMQHENGPMQFNVVNDVVKLTLFFWSDLSFVICTVLHKTMFQLMLGHVRWMSYLVWP